MSQAEQQGDTYCRNAQELRRWLERQGFAVSKNTIYNHIGPGKIERKPEGFDQRQALRYAENHLKRRDGSRGESRSSLQRRKQEAEIARIIAQTRLAELKAEIAEGKYLRREQVEADLAARARVLKADLLAFARLHIDDLVVMLRGDPARAPEVLAWFEERIEEWLHRYATAGELSLGSEQ